MRIFVKVKPGAKKESVEKASEDTFLVCVKEPAREGKANEAIARALAEHFRVPKSNVSIVSGHRSKTKIVMIK